MAIVMTDGIHTPPHDHDGGNVHHDHDDVGKDNVHHVFGQAPFLSRLRLRRLLVKAKVVVRCHYLAVIENNQSLSPPFHNDIICR